VCEERFLNFVE